VGILEWPFLKIAQVIIDVVEEELKLKVQYTRGDKWIGFTTVQHKNITLIPPVLHAMFKTRRKVLFEKLCGCPLWEVYASKCDMSFGNIWKWIVKSMCKG